MTTYTGRQGRYFEDFAVGDVYHPLGRTVTGTDSISCTLLTGHDDVAIFHRTLLVYRGGEGPRAAAVGAGSR